MIKNLIFINKMKIYILPIDKKFKPERQPWKYPRHNKQFGVEEDFSEYLRNNPELITGDEIAADWHYLGPYWTRWHVGHDFAKTGLGELQQAVDKIMIDDKKTFTICQYDDGPVVNVGQTVQFLASRKTTYGIDIPLLSSPHRLPFFTPSKKYVASFMGKAKTHSIRQEMIDAIKNKEEFLLYNGNKGSRFFVKNTLRSYVSLCPRGYGGSSFRLFEAMQLGVVPFLIGDLDTRPFKKYIDWDKISLYTNKPGEIQSILHSRIKEDLLEMGKEAKKIYQEKLAYQKWCQLVIQSLIDNNQSL